MFLVPGNGGFYLSFKSSRYSMWVKLSEQPFPLLLQSQTVGSASELSFPQKMWLSPGNKSIYTFGGPPVRESRGSGPDTVLSAPSATCCFQSSGGGHPLGVRLGNKIVSNPWERDCGNSPGWPFLGSYASKASKN